MNSQCPPPESLRMLFEGARPPQNAAGLLKHLEDCHECREKLATLLPGVEVPGVYLPENFWSAASTAEHPVADTAGHTVVQPLESGSGVFSPAKPRQVFEVPRRLGGYEILRVLGRGGMGLVLKGFDAPLNRFVAVKLLFPHLATNDVYRRRFAREARSAATIGSDHATAVYSVGEEGDAPYIVMEYIAGEDLETRLNRDGRLPIPLAICIARQVAAGLAAAHSQGIVHRDIKPANVLLENSSGTEHQLHRDCAIRVKITDFGIAKSSSMPGITGVQETVGTPEYMAPEQISGEPLDPRSDLYSLGVTLYRMVSDQLPFTGKTAIACFTQHFSKEPPSLTAHVADLPAWFESLILRLLRKDPAERVQTAAEVVRLLDDGYAHLQGPPTDPEDKRLAVLRSYRVLDTASEQAFDDLTFLAAHICGTPIAMVSLIDEDRQWFKSKVGLSITQTARNISFCQHTIRGTTPLIVSNAATDPLFADNPTVRQEPNIRFYAGVPLIDPEGCALGSLCVLDRVARGLTSDQVSALSALGRLVMTQLTMRRELMERREAGKSTT
ncbi:MAG: protein kinase [Planctomycetes bacterium]|nr:protein kinase [Planctomycetota bacterium]